MLTRLHKILIALLAVQIVLAIVVLVRGDDTGVIAEHTILASFDAAKVTRLQVWGDGAKQPVDLQKKGDHWVVASSYDYPVDTSKIDAVLGPIAKMKAEAPIATQKTRHAQLHVADDQFDRKLVITMDGKDTTLYLGGSAGLRRTAVRIGGDDRVYAASDVTAWTAGAQASAWVDPEYLKIPEDEIAKVTIEHAGTQTELAKDDAKDKTAWTVSIGGAPVKLAAGESLDTAGIEKVVNDLSTIEMDGPADPKRDAGQPTAVVTIERKATGATSQAPTVLDIVEDGDSYWVHERGTNRAADVGKSRLIDVVEVTRDKLVKAPAPPAAAAKPATPAASVAPAAPAAAARSQK